MRRKYWKTATGQGSKELEYTAKFNSYFPFVSDVTLFVFWSGLSHFHPFILSCNREYNPKWFYVVGTSLNMLTLENIFFWLGTIFKKSPTRFKYPKNICTCVIKGWVNIMLSHIKMIILIFRFHLYKNQRLWCKKCEKLNTSRTDTNTFRGKINKLKFEWINMLTRCREKHQRDRSPYLQTL